MSGAAQHLHARSPRPASAPCAAGQISPLPISDACSARQQHAGRGGDARIQPQLADHDIMGQRLRIDHPHRPEQGEARSAGRNENPSLGLFI